MGIKPIKNDSDYKKALKRLDEVFDAPEDTQEGDEAEVLAILVEDFEEKYHPIEQPDPIEAIRIRMEELHMQQLDLVDAVGDKSRVSEVLNRKRKLTVEMIRNLSKKLNLSADVLVRDYKLIK